MAQHICTEGYAIVSANGMIADRNHEMPAGLRIEADARFFATALDAATIVVHGRNSHEAGWLRSAVVPRLSTFYRHGPRLASGPPSYFAYAKQVFSRFARTRLPYFAQSGSPKF
jgi:hypothetical protein